MSDKDPSFFEKEYYVLLDKYELLLSQVLASRHGTSDLTIKQENEQLKEQLDRLRKRIEKAGL